MSLQALGVVLLVVSVALFVAWGLLEGGRNEDCQAVLGECAAEVAGVSGARERSVRAVGPDEREGQMSYRPIEGMRTRFRVLPDSRILRIDMPLGCVSMEHCRVRLYLTWSQAVREEAGEDCDDATASPALLQWLEDWPGFVE